jgi:zinc/manganese transport system ATP-binding protein
VGYEIVVDHLNIHLDGAWVLRDLSFNVKPGEFLGIIGPNGAGKTTLLRALLGMIPPDSGSITFQCRDSQGRDGQFMNGRRSGTSLLGYTPQSRQMDLGAPLSAWDFVSFGLSRWLPPWQTRQERERVREAMLATDCYGFAAKPVSRLSGGERQRLFIAQALVRHPSILLLDEPTSNLDPGAQENIASIVHLLNQERGISVLFVTHDVNLIAEHAHRILYLTRGQYAIGSVKQVLQSSVLSRLYEAPVEVVHVGSKIIVITSADTTRTPICWHGDCNQEAVGK